MDAKTVRLIADSTAPSAGLGESGGCRRFRHTMATLVLESGFGFTYAIRWLRMNKTPYMLFYEYEPGSDQVWIVCIWSGARRAGPDFSARG